MKFWYLAAFAPYYYGDAALLNGIRYSPALDRLLVLVDFKQVLVA